jgi:hypothetical protein
MGSQMEEIRRGHKAAALLGKRKPELRIVFKNEGPLKKFAFSNMVLSPLVSSRMT